MEAAADLTFSLAVPVNQSPPIPFLTNTPQLNRPLIFYCTSLPSRPHFYPHLSVPSPHRYPIHSCLRPTALPSLIDFSERAIHTSFEHCVFFVACHHGHRGLRSEHESQLTDHSHRVFQSISSGIDVSNMFGRNWNIFATSP